MYFARCFTWPSQSVTSINISNNEKFLVTSSDDKLIIVWDLENNSQISRLERLLQTIHHVEFAFNNNYIISKSTNNQVIFWKFPNFEKIYEFPKNISVIKAFSNYNRIAAGTDSGSILFISENISCNYDNYSQVIQAHKGKVISIGINACYDYFLTFAEDNQIKVWASMIKHKNLRFRFIHSKISFLYINTNLDFILARDSENYAIWQISTKRCLESETIYFNFFAFGTNKKIIVTLKNCFEVINLIDCRKKYEINYNSLFGIYDYLPKHYSQVKCFALSNENDLLLLGLRNEKVIGWDIERKKNVFDMATNLNGILSINFSKSDKYFGIVSKDYKILVYHLKFKHS